MRLLCLFRLCHWIWHFNAEAGGITTGVYQCGRCKSLSIGAPRDPANQLNFLRSGLFEEE